MLSQSINNCKLTSAVIKDSLNTFQTVNLRNCINIFAVLQKRHGLRIFFVTMEAFTNSDVLLKNCFERFSEIHKKIASMEPIFAGVSLQL